MTKKLKEFLNSDFIHWSDMDKGERKTVFSFGGGVDSTGILFEFDRQKKMPDIIIFADTGDYTKKNKGNERDDIYEHVLRLKKWLKDKWDRELYIVRTKETLEDECLRRNTLPALAMGFHTCSQKHKIRPIAQWLRKNNHRKIIKIIGYDSNEFDRARRGLTSVENGQNTEEYGIDLKLWFPLIEWGKYRSDLKKEINEQGFCASKSSCFFCPAMSLEEVIQLKRHDPQKYERAIKIERGANLNNTKGLGRSWNWEQSVNNYESQGQLFDESVMDELKGVQTCGCINW